MFIADSGNNRIRKIDRAGHITTVAGNGNRGAAGDGGSAIAAQLANPRAVVADSSGSLYIADSDNHRVRKIDQNSTITTLAGTGAFGYSGDGGLAAQAQLQWPAGVAVDSVGNVYIADTNNCRIRMVNPSGVINTVAGNGYWNWNYSGDGGPPTHTSLASPTGLILDPSGSFYVADQLYNNVRVLTPSGLQPVLTVQSAQAGDRLRVIRKLYRHGDNALLAGPTSGPLTFSASVRSAEGPYGYFGCGLDLRYRSVHPFRRAGRG